MMPDQLQEEVNREIWKQYWDAHPDEDPVKVMCAVVVITWFFGVIAMFALLIIAIICMLCGV